MRTIRFRRPSAGTTIAFVALTAALSGTAVALPGKNTVDSGDIKSKQVKNADLASNAVSSTKVKDGSLLAKDFKSGQLPAGAKGDPGTPGAPGQNGVASALATTNGSVNINAGGAEFQILTKTVPVGTYVVHAKTSLHSLSAQTIECYLSANNSDTALDNVQWESPNATGDAPASLLAVVTVTTQSPLRVRCSHSGAAMTPGGSANNSQLVAMPVGAVG